MKKLKHILLFLMLTASCLAVDEIHVDYPTGDTLYAARFQLDGDVFVTNGSADEVWSTAADYDVTMTENGNGGHYVGSFDVDGNIGDGTFKITVYQQLGGAPANSDPAIYVGQIVWKDGAEFDAEALVDDIWDEDISRPNHNVGQSAAKMLRESDISITADTAQGPGTGNNQIQLANGASDVDGAYDPAMVFIKDGTGAGQSRNILQYDGGTRTATVDRNWKVNPDSDSEYVILADAGREHVNEGLAQQGSSTIIRLNTLASSANDAYRNQYVFIRSGTGEDQVRRIESYNGSTKDATVSREWDINPDSTSGYIIKPFACVEVQAISETELTTDAGANFKTFFDASSAVTTTEVSDIDSILTLATFMRDVMEGDVWTNTATTPWRQEIRSKGTESALTEKKLFQVGGEDVTSIRNAIGQKTEP